jgi:hypothetical protein
MQLSAELFETTLHRIKGDGGTGGVERRTTPRVGLRSLITLLPLVNGAVAPGIEVRTRDISRTGLGIITHKPLKVNNHYLLSLPSESEGAGRTFYCTVRNCQSLAAGIFGIGISFEELHASEAA